MAVTPAQFGRALNFGKANPLPMWTRADESPFPSALGWTQIFQVSEIIVPVTISYGAPFIDRQVEILGVLTMAANMQNIDARALIKGTRLTFSVDESDII